MAIRFATERIVQNKALHRAYVTSLAFGAGTLLLLSSGCRSAWNTQSNQPSFDRLMEIENSSATMPPSFQSQVNNRRPGGASPSNLNPANSLPAQMAEMPQGDLTESPNTRYAQKPNGGASRRISDMDDYADNDVTGASTEKQELLRNMQRALQQAEGSGDDPSKLANSPAPNTKNPNSRKKSPQSGSQDRYAVHISDDDEEQGLKPGENMVALRPVPSKDKEQKASSRRMPDGQRRGDFLSDEYPTNASHNRKGDDDSVRSAVAESKIDADLEDSTRGDIDRDAGDRDGRTKKELTWQQHIQQAIKQLDSVDKDSLETPQSRIRQQVLSRMLALTLDDRQGMLKPVDGLQPGEQDYFNYQFSALADAIDPEANPSASRKWSTVMINQRKAHSNLASISNLEINNLAFCTEVVDFGVTVPFPTYTFKAYDEVLLYLELDNFVSEKSRDGKGFETQLQGSYEIVDASGRRVMDQTLPSDSHICKNMRRDYFISYRLRLPDKISIGSYTLKVTIEDVKGHKFGQKEIQFQIQ